MYKVLLLCVLIGLVASISVRDAKKEFHKFQKKYNKSYSATELGSRFQIFQENLRRYEDLQKMNPKAKFGVTQFSDLSPKEFSKYYLMPSMNFSRDYVVPASKTDFSATAKGFAPNPKNWDWFTQGVCTPIYNQGQCGSCWAFSATETIESYYKIQGGQLTGLSMEQIVDCDTAGEDQGCEGGFPTGAYTYVESAGGIDSYTSYPYTAGEGQSGTCQFSKANVVTSVASYQSISGETGLYQQASTAGPVSVCVDAESWSGYEGGILTECGSDVDHCVQLTGYQNYGQQGQAYWIVRNSWGTTWGENGFIWIQIGQDLCSIGDYATIVADTN